VYNANRIQFGKIHSLSWPLAVEGKGKIVFGDDVQLEKNVKLGAGIGSQLVFGQNTLLQHDVSLYTSENVVFVLVIIRGLKRTAGFFFNDVQIGNNVIIASHCQIF
jgi:carbonic anhydrase/acetyltransferase-like protein (isoleucine patch superfamily)